MSDLDKLKKEIIAFRDARDWKQFHNAKDLSLSLSLEAAELLEHFQWKNPEEIQKVVNSNKDEIGEEVADILNYLILLCEEVGIDILEVTRKKLSKSESKYPVDKSKGTHKKYTELSKE